MGFIYEQDYVNFKNLTMDVMSHIVEEKTIVKSWSFAVLSFCLQKLQHEKVSRKKKIAIDRTMNVFFSMLRFLI